MNKYEIAVLYDPDLEIDLEKATAKTDKIIKDNSGKIVNSDNWGKRKLAYPISKHESAIYIIYSVELPPNNVHKVEANLKITDEIIRFLIVSPDFKKIAKAEAAKKEKKEKQDLSNNEEKVESDRETPEKSPE